MKNKRSLYIALLLLVGVAITIGYAVLNQTLKIKGTTGIASNSWIIYFDNLVERPGTLTPTMPTTINDAKDRVDFTISLNKPGDNYTFEVDIVNDGSTDAMIYNVGITGVPEELDGIIEWKINYLNGDELQKCDELLANTRRRIRVVVNYNKDIDELPEEQSLDLQLNIQYVYMDKTACPTTNPSEPDPIDPYDGRYTLTIDPNYGTYLGTDAPQVLRMTAGQVYVISEEPVHPYHNFTGWTSSNTEAYNTEGNIITMPEEDVTVIAGWTQEGEGEHDYNHICYQITGGNVFSELTDALEAVQNGKTITLLANSCSITETTYVDKDIIFDLNGHVFNTYDRFFIRDGNVTITDSSKRKSGTFTAHNENGYNAIYVDKGSLTINGGTYNDSSELIMCSSTTGNTVNISNATINMNDEHHEAYGIHHFGKELTITDTVFNFDQYGNRGSHVIYSQDQTTEEGRKEPNIIRNVEINIEGHNAGYGLPFWGMIKPYDIDGLKITMTGQHSGSTWPLYFTSEYKSAIKNVDIKIDTDVTYVQNIKGIYGQLSTAENVNIDIDVHNSATGNIAAFDNTGAMEYNTGKISIKRNNGGYSVAGFENVSNSTFKDIDLDIELANGALYGIYGSSNNFENINMNLKTKNNYIYGTKGNNFKNVNLNINLDAEAGTNGYIQGIEEANTIKNSIINIIRTGNGEVQTDGINKVTTLEDSTLTIKASNKVKGVTTIGGVIKNSTIDIESSYANYSRYDNPTYGIYNTGELIINNSTIKAKGIANSTFVNTIYSTGVVTIYDSIINSSAICYYTSGTTAQFNIDSQTESTCSISISNEGATINEI